MTEYQRHYLEAVATAWLVSYIGLMLLYGVCLFIYHYGVFMPRIRRKLKTDVDELIEPDTGRKLKELADKYNAIAPEKTQEDKSSLSEKTQEDVDQQKTTVSKVMRTPPTTPRVRKLKKKASPVNDKTALSDTPVYVSRVEREPLVEKTQVD